MKFEETPTDQPSRRRGKTLAPLGQTLKTLQVGEHITIAYPPDATPPFREAIKHYRTFFKMGFVYEETGPGIYDVWRATETNERLPKLAPLGKKLNSLQFGQCIIVEYAADKTPSFSVTMAHYRKYLKKPFLYEAKGQETYEVWMGTPEQVAAAHRGLRHVQTTLEQSEVEAMKVHPDIHRDWVTVALLARDCGIPAGTGRHLPWENVCFDERKIEVKMRGAPYSVRRHLTDDVHIHLQTMRPPSVDRATPICPALARLSNKDFADAWCKVRRILNLPTSRTLSALTWPWRKANPKLRDHEIALNHIAALEKKWLSPAELKITSKIGAVADNIIPLPNVPVW